MEILLPGDLSCEKRIFAPSTSSLLRSFLDFLLFSIWKKPCEVLTFSDAYAAYVMKFLWNGCLTDPAQTHGRGIPKVTEASVRCEVIW